MNPTIKDSDKKTRAKMRQRKRRAKMTKEEIELKRSCDREYRNVFWKQSLKIQDDESDTTTIFTSERLKLSEMSKNLDNEMQKYSKNDTTLLLEKKLEDFKLTECVTCDTFFWSIHANCYCTSHSSVLTTELMKIGEIPPELTGLSYVEELLIAKVHPMISIYRLKGGQYGFRGNVINFRQDVSSFAKQLPHSLAVLKGLISVYSNTPTFHRDFLIRRNAVSVALHWLKNHNKYYYDVNVDLEAIKKLPENGHFTDVVQVDVPDNEIDHANDDHENIIQRVIIPGINEVSTSDKIEHQLKWPQTSSQLINEFNSHGYIVQAFPVLFPFGFGDYLNVKNRQITARVYFQYLMQKIDRRFSKHKRFPYFALNSILRWEALSLGTVNMKKKPELKHPNIEHLKDLVSESISIPKSTMVFSSSIRGSKSYWMSRTCELEAMVDRFNLPTLFFSLSAADHHWPRQFEILLGDSDVDVDLTETRRRNLLVANADLCSDYFYETVSIFITEVLVPFLKVLEYWFRFEWQMRGVGHVHGVLWVHDAPKIVNFETISETEKVQVIDYFSMEPPDCNYVKTANHPCRLKVSEVQDKNEDIAALVNTVQRHKCSLRCLKKISSKSKKEPNLTCRHNFPHKLQEESSIERNARGHFEFFPKRNDPNINKYMEFILTTYRANHDPTPILPYDGFVRYISKYTSKGEIKSEDLIKILKTVVFRSDAHETVKSVIHKIFVNLAADRDYSFQEVIHLLKGHKLYKSSRSFLVLNLSVSEWEAKGDLSDLSYEEKTPDKNIDSLTLYSKRPVKFEKMNLVTAMKWFNLKTFKKYNKERIVRITPRFYQQKEVTEDFWLQNALLNVPWRNIDELLVEDNWEATCSAHSITMDMFPYAIYSKTDEKHDDADYEDGNDCEHITKDDWMNICNLRSSSNTEHDDILGQRSIDLSYPWSSNQSVQYHHVIMLY
ncbi:LOW QUALITY PROTEIN: putative LRR receptor-like serine/threonine-protein kinase [Frankliniella fusca]|uniref:LRR receptor-like serine/threonine-protein kinase n=1 Tax=Frankliniella fusca TaxID=407009 RepID=A0AAE1HHV7_9NEOP|nr:LOW QUALITY PROTEIN: putative LRR receptor-like serine/threonine-protein kinase [Frankliniella fusca]